MCSRSLRKYVGCEQYEKRLESRLLNHLILDKDITIELMCVSLSQVLYCLQGSLLRLGVGRHMPGNLKHKVCHSKPFTNAISCDFGYYSSHSVFFFKYKSNIFYIFWSFLEWCEIFLPKGWIFLLVVLSHLLLVCLASFSSILCCILFKELQRFAFI